jgi:hypothetical protein
VSAARVPHKVIAYPYGDVFIAGSTKRPSAVSQLERSEISVKLFLLEAKVGNPLGSAKHEQSLAGATYGLYGRVDSPSGIAGMFMTSAASGTVIAANNASRRIFRLDSTGNVFALGTFSPNGADFAESVAVRGPRRNYQPGDVMVIDPDHDRQFLLSQESYSTRVAGIYSTKPGVLGSRHELEVATDEVPLAMVGIVPCHVTTENGPIHRGDILVTSSRPGYAMKGTDSARLVGAIVGKSLQGLESGSGTIEVMVTLQ